MSENITVAPISTIFERVWQKNDGHLFRSERHGIMAIADAFPKMPLQVVVAPAKGEPGKDVHFYDLELIQQRKLLEVGLGVGARILAHCMPGQRSMIAIEGFGVRDHAHLVCYAGERGQGEARYNGEVLGAEAVQRTIDAITFGPVDAESLEARLDLIR